MPPTEELIAQAQAIHYGHAPIGDQLMLRSATYGGQAAAIDVVDYRDSRVATLLHAAREGELFQAVHRARPVTIGAALGPSASQRAELEIHLFTSHPVPDLPIDRLLLYRTGDGWNAGVRAEAEAKILAAEQSIRDQGEEVTVNAIAHLTGSNKGTISQVLHRKRAVHTLKDDLLHTRVNRPLRASTTLASWVEEV